MKKLAILLLPVFVLFSCNAQTDNKSSQLKEEKTEQKLKPKIDYKVNKEYDENGNLIKLDSTYTYYYSNIDLNEQQVDSIYKSFNKHLNFSSSFDDSFFEEFFKNENYIEEDFFQEDFFKNNTTRNEEMMKQMITRMDSIKNQFLIEQFPLKDEKEEIKENK